MSPLGIAFLLSMVPVALFGQYTADAAGPPPGEVASGIVQTLLENGFKIANNGTPHCEIWFRRTLPSGSGSSAPNVTLASIPPGTLVGLIRFDAGGFDRRGQAIRAGVYTLRYGIMPRNGDHEGAAPQRDFLLLLPAAEDKDANATPNLDALVQMSRKASGTRHPAILSIRKTESESSGFSRQNDTDWVLETKLGDLPIAVILIGSAGL